jgi:hypothetical protein
MPRNEPGQDVAVEGMDKRWRVYFNSEETIKEQADSELLFV